MHRMAACPCENEPHENPLSGATKTALWVGGYALAALAVYSLWKSSQGNVAPPPSQTSVVLTPGIQTTSGGNGTVYVELPPGGQWLSQNGFTKGGTQPIAVTNFDVTGRPFPSPPQSFGWRDAQGGLQMTVLNFTA